MSCNHSSLEVFHFAEKEVHKRCSEALVKRRGKGTHSLIVYRPPSCLPKANTAYEGLINEFDIYYPCILVETYPHKFIITPKIE